MTARRHLSGLLALALAVAAPAAAQTSACGSGTDGTRCRLGLRAAEETLAGAVLVAAGGNPWLGSPSTLGFRTETMPRLAFQTRTTFARVDVPGRGTGLEGATLFSVTGGFTMGLFDGVAPGATVGGLGSVDIVAEAGALLLPGGPGFESRAPFTWSLGLRVGVVRESFNVPGITTSVAYRRVGETRFDQAGLLTRDAAFSWQSASAWTFRGVVGKRLSGISFTGGVGWDDARADATLLSRTDAGPVNAVTTRADAGRFLTFVGASWTSLIFALSAEAGWQFGGGGTVQLDRPDPAAGGRAYGSLAARLTF